MTAASIQSVVDALRATSVLNAEQESTLSRDLAARFPDPESLLRDLVERAWLSSYQADCILNGRSAELLLGQYLVLDRLGEGGMGQVLKVRHRQLDRVQALKLIRPGLLDSPQAVQRFRRETRAAAALQHVNVALVFDAGTIEPGRVHFLAMEYIDGIDLHRLVRRRGPLPVTEACEYLRQAALGLQHAHEKGLVHRDIKPGNLLLTRDGVVKVVDFGLASRRQEEGESGPLTRENAMLGTPDFMAPEQGLDARRADIRADVYSLGCTLYFLLTGKVPYPADSAGGKLLGHVQAPLPDLRAIRPDIPVGLDGVLARMMAKAPDQRFATPGEVARALAPFSRATTGYPGRMRSEGAVPESTGTVSHPEVAATRETLGATDAPPTTVVVNPSRGRVKRLLPLGMGVLVAACLITGLAIYLAIHDRSSKPAKKPPKEDQPLIVEGDGPEEPVEGLVAVLGTHRLRHWDDVFAVAVSPDGRLIASGGRQPIIQLWGVEWGEEVKVKRAASLKGHENAITVLAFQPGGRLLASGSDDETVRLWDSATRQERTSLAARSGVKGIAFHPLGRLLAAACDNGRVRLWELREEGEPESKPDLEPLPKAATAVAFSRDGRWLVAGCEDGTLTWWPVDAGGRGKGERITRPGHDGKAVLALAFAPGPNVLLASGGVDHHVSLWRPTDEKPLAHWEAHQHGFVSALAFAPDGSSLATGSYDDTVRLWTLDEMGKPPKRRATLERHFGYVQSIAFFPGDGQRLVSGGSDNTVRLWDGKAGKEVTPTVGAVGPVWSVAFDREGTMLAAGGQDHQVRLWAVNGWKSTMVSKPHAGFVRAVAFSPKAPLLACGVWDDAVKLYEVNETGEGRLTGEIGDTRWRPDALSFHPDGKRLAVGGEKGAVSLWDVATRKRERELPGHAGRVSTLAFSPSGELLATGDGDSEVKGTARLWNWQAPSSEVLDGHDHFVSALAWGTEGKALFTGDARCQLRRFGAERWKEEAVYEEHHGFITAIVRTPEGGIVSADATGLVILRDERGKEMRRWKLCGGVNQLAVSPDGRLLATANQNGTIYVLRLPAAGTP